MVFAVRKYGICGAEVWYFVGVRGYLRSVREAFRGRVWVFCRMLGTIFGF